MAASTIAPIAIAIPPNDMMFELTPMRRMGTNAMTMAIGIVNNALAPTAADFGLLAPHSPSRNTAMIDFSPSEFSRFRLQIAQDDVRIGQRDRVVLLQYIHSLGAHGAHKF